MTVLLIAPVISVGTLKGFLWVNDTHVKNITDDISREYKSLGLGPTKVEIYESTEKSAPLAGFGDTQVCVAFPLFLDDGAITYEDACKEAMALIRSMMGQLLMPPDTWKGTIIIDPPEQISPHTQQYWSELFGLCMFYILKHQRKIININPMRIGNERNVFLQICCEPLF